jgi:hypothetical protein
MMTTWIKIVEVTLSDGSKVFNVAVGDEELACESEDAAYRLAEAIEAASLNTQFDGWARVTRAA